MLPALPPARSALTDAALRPLGAPVVHVSIEVTVTGMVPASPAAPSLPPCPSVPKGPLSPPGIMKPSPPSAPPSSAPTPPPLAPPLVLPTPNPLEPFPEPQAPATAIAAIAAQDRAHQCRGAF